MKKYSYLLILGVVMFCSCWDETDIITFFKDGTIKFESQIFVRDTGYTPSSIEEWMKPYITELTDAKWEAEWDWVSKSYPYQLKVKGKGNIKTIGDSSSFYYFKKISKNKYEWQFNKVALQTDEDRRIINISKSSVALKSSKGKTVNSIIAKSSFTETSAEKYILDLN
jgi:hypothetical protein